MKKSITLLVAAVALAGPAAAQSVKVSLAGKDPAAIRTDIAHAARVVCREATMLDQFQFYTMPRCVADTIKAAEAKASGLAAASNPPAKLASAR
jgi:hypothetical protein